MLRRALTTLVMTLACAALGIAAAALHREPVAPAPAGASPSADGAEIYARAQPSLFQVRVLNAVSGAQQYVGSGFVVGDDGLAITNYHVVAAIVLEPQRFSIEALAADGKRAELEVLRVDISNDLALVRVKSPETWPALVLDGRPLVAGERLYSLGNPKDLGFALTQGTFGGRVARPIYPRIFYSGAINAGMSGGPAVDAAGRVVGINVEKRTDGEQMGFLVPAEFALQLMEGAVSDASLPSRQAFERSIAEQLLRHQQLLTDRLLAARLPERTLGPYQVPVREAPGVRCWATAKPRPELRYESSTLSCDGDDGLFVADGLYTGAIWVQHEYVVTRDLLPLQFMEVFGKTFRADAFGNYPAQHWSAEECSDAFVERADRGAPLRAVLCLRALRRFSGLYDVALVTATVDSGQRGVVSRLRAVAVSRENGERIVRAFLDGMGRAP